MVSGELRAAHPGVGRREALDWSVALLEEVEINKPRERLDHYPNEYSGGMLQRVMIAAALVGDPDLLIADEPTTALDVTTQAQVLGLMKDLQRETGMALILVTHDLGVVANMAEQVVVMHKGRVMESGSAEAMLKAPAHPYTRQLFDAAPSIPANPGLAPQPPHDDLILEMQAVSKTYVMRSKSGWKGAVMIPACRGVDLELPRGKTLAIVGESGSGKTTAARIALGAEPPDPGGQVLFRAGKDQPTIPVHALDRTQRKAFQKQAQMVFQDPYSSLSPRMRILDALSEPLDIHGIGTRAERRDRAAAMLKQVGLGPDMLQRYPHAFSGGQRQRISIARALICQPQFIVADESVAALDVSTQAEILSLFKQLRDDLGLTILFISHDLSVIANLCDWVCVMRQGELVEQGSVRQIFLTPQQQYTQQLIAAIPLLDNHQKAIDTEQSEVELLSAAG